MDDFIKAFDSHFLKCATVKSATIKNNQIDVRLSCRYGGSHLKRYPIYVCNTTITLTIEDCFYVYSTYMQPLLLKEGSFAILLVINGITGHSIK